MEMSEKKGANSKVPAVPEYLFPRGDIAQMLAFTTTVITKTMLGDLRVRDYQAIQGILTSGTALMPAVPEITSKLIFNLWKQGAEDAGLDMDRAMEKKEDSEILTKVKGIVEQMESLSSTPQTNGLAQAQTPQMALPAGTQQPPTGGAGATATPQPPAVLQRFGG
jgi:hypothetical protein